MKTVIEGLNTPGGRSVFIGGLWLATLLLIIGAKLSGIQIEAEGRAALAQASNILLGILVFNLGGGSKV